MNMHAIDSKFVKDYQKCCIIYANFESISKPATDNKHNVQTLKNMKICLGTI